MIQTIGDSHSSFGWSKIDGVKCNWLGPKLMYSFKKTDFTIKNISENDYIVFCYGEIDVRCHIKKNIINNDYEITIQNICNKYVNEILDIKNTYNLKNIYIYNILPTRRVDTIEPYSITCDNYIKYDEVKAQPFPFIGTDVERKTYTLFFNKELKKLSKINGLGFIDIYDKYTDVDGYLNMNLSDGTVHIGVECHLSDFLKQNIK